MNSKKTNFKNIEERLREYLLSKDRMEKFEKAAEPCAVAFEAYLKLKESPSRAKVTYSFFEKVYNSALYIYKERKSKKTFNHNDVIKSLKEAYELMLDNKPVVYKGPLLETGEILGVCLNIDENLSRYKSRKKEQNISPIELILSSAFQLGIQQGIYMCVGKTISSWS